MYILNIKQHNGDSHRKTATFLEVATNHSHTVDVGNTKAETCMRRMRLGISIQGWLTTCTPVAYYCVDINKHDTTLLLILQNHKSSCTAYVSANSNFDISLFFYQSIAPLNQTLKEFHSVIKKIISSDQIIFFCSFIIRFNIQIYNKSPLTCDESECDVQRIDTVGKHAQNDSGTPDQRTHDANQASTEQVR